LISQIGSRFISSLKAMFVDPSGRLVNYHRLHASQTYRDLCELATRLTTINLDNVTENERKTFFISNYHLANHRFTNKNFILQIFTMH
jgi:hypothetical protein